MAVPQATMTESWRKELAKSVHDGTTPTLTDFVWGEGGQLTGSSFTANLTLDSTIITVQDISILKASQLVQGPGIDSGTYINSVNAVTITGDLTLSSTTINNISDLKHLRVSQPILGDSIPAGTIISTIDQSASSITINQAATATATESLTAGDIVLSKPAITGAAAGAALTVTGPRLEDPTNTTLYNENFTKPINPGTDKVLDINNFSTTLTGSLDDDELVGQNISEFGIMADVAGASPPAKALAYYFTFPEVNKTAGEAYQLQITVKF